MAWSGKENDSGRCHQGALSPEGAPGTAPCSPGGQLPKATTGGCACSKREGLPPCGGWKEGQWPCRSPGPPHRHQHQGQVLTPQVGEALGGRVPCWSHLVRTRGDQASPRGMASGWRLWAHPGHARAEGRGSLGIGVPRWPRSQGRQDACVVKSDCSLVTRHLSQPSRRGPRLEPACPECLSQVRFTEKKRQVPGPGPEPLVSCHPSTVCWGQGGAGPLWSLPSQVPGCQPWRGSGPCAEPRRPEDGYWGCLLGHLLVGSSLTVPLPHRWRAGPVAGARWSLPVLGPSLPPASPARAEAGPAPLVSPGPGAAGSTGSGTAGLALGQCLHSSRRVSLALHRDLRGVAWAVPSPLRAADEFHRASPQGAFLLRSCTGRAGPPGVATPL